MGAELRCAARWAGKRSEGTALLETAEVIFRGEFRVRLPVSEITSVTADSGELTLRTGAGELVLELGSAAGRWADKIRNPPSRLDKMGIRERSQVCLVGEADPAFLTELAAAGMEQAGENDAEVVVVSAQAPPDLAHIGRLAGLMRRDAGLWIVSPRGSVDLPQSGVMAAGREAGLVDVKVCRFSDTCTALKFVVPKDRR